MAKTAVAPKPAYQDASENSAGSFLIVPGETAATDSTFCSTRRLVSADGHGNLRRILRNGVVETIAWLPGLAKKVLLQNLRRPLLWALFRIEPDRFTLARAGPSFQRFWMWLDWQSNLDFVLGNYEPEVVLSLRRALQPGHFCVDIGANLGYFSLLMANLVGPQGLVAAFEPFPKNLQALQKNIQLNQLTNVKLEPLALAAQSGPVSIFYDPNEPLSATPSLIGYAIGEERQQMSVPCRTLDDYLSDLKRIPALVKIDVEGAELGVLQGARHTLKSGRPILLLELHGWAEPASQEVLSYLDQCGYVIKVLAKKAREATLLCTRT